MIPEMPVSARVQPSHGMALHYVATVVVQGRWQETYRAKNSRHSQNPKMRKYGMTSRTASVDP